LQSGSNQQGMKRIACSFALLLVAQASAAPSMPAPPPAAVAPAPPPVVAPAANPLSIPAGQAGPNEAVWDLKSELKRLMVGNQAGIVKVLGPNRQGEAYVRSIDDQSFARLNQEHCGSIFQALGLPQARIRPTAQSIMINYATLPHKEAVAFLGAAACSSCLDDSLKDKTESFLVQVMEQDKDVHARRQALLALAVQPHVSPATAERVLKKYEGCENLWETFPMQQFFHFHAPALRKLPNFDQIRQRVASVNSLYTPCILEHLDKS